MDVKKYIQKDFFKKFKISLVLSSGIFYGSLTGVLGFHKETSDVLFTTNFGVLLLVVIVITIFQFQKYYFTFSKEKIGWFKRFLELLYWLVFFLLMFYFNLMLALIGITLPFISLIWILMITTSSAFLKM